MPNISASDYTAYLKFKAASASPIKPNIQTRDNASTSQTVVNANVLASQAAFVVAPARSTIVGNSRVRPVQPERTNNPNALSTLAGSGTLSSSAIQRPGGLPGPARSSQSTYYSPAQNAGWKNAGPPGH
jgi:hypothetical protein